MSYTKGEWVSKDDPMFDRKVVTAESREGMIDICTIPIGFDGYIEDEQQSNVNLIAAAPELLEALENIVCDGGFVGSGEMSDAKAAIAKAKGY